MSVEAHELAIEIWDEQGGQMGISTKLLTESEIIPDPYSLKSDWSQLPTSFGLTALLLLLFFFLEVNTFLFFDLWVVFPWLPCAAFTRRIFGGFSWRCCGSANIEGTGFNLVRTGPSKWTEHIPVCLRTFKLFRWQAAIHRICRSRSDTPTVQYLFALRWGNGKNPCQFQIFFKHFFCF